MSSLPQWADERQRRRSLFCAAVDRPLSLLNGLTLLPDTISIRTLMSELLSANDKRSSSFGRRGRMLELLICQRTYHRSITGLRRDIG